MYQYFTKNLGKQSTQKKNDILTLIPLPSRLTVVVLQQHQISSLLSLLINCAYKLQKMAFDTKNELSSISRYQNRCREAAVNVANGYETALVTLFHYRLSSYFPQSYKRKTVLSRAYLLSPVFQARYRQACFSVAKVQSSS